MEISAWSLSTFTIRKEPWGIRWFFFNIQKHLWAPSRFFSLKITLSQCLITFISESPWLFLLKWRFLVLTPHEYDSECWWAPGVSILNKDCSRSKKTTLRPGILLSRTVHQPQEFRQTTSHSAGRKYMRLTEKYPLPHQYNRIQTVICLWSHSFLFSVLEAWIRSQPQSSDSPSAPAENTTLSYSLWAIGKGRYVLENHFSSLLTLLSDFIDVSVLFNMSHDR